MLNNDECLSPLRFERVRVDSVEPPPGFEPFCTFKPSMKVPRRQPQTMERTVTRSHKKLDKSSSQGILESLIKLAKESIEVGKILGVKVIDKEEATVRRIINI